MLLFWEQNKVSALVFLYDICQAKRNNQYNISISRLCSLNSNKKRTNTMKLLRMKSRWSIKVFNYGKGHSFPFGMKPETSRRLHSSVPTKINNLVRLLRYQPWFCWPVSLKQEILPFHKSSSISQQPLTLRYSFMAKTN